MQRKEKEKVRSEGRKNLGVSGGKKEESPPKRRKSLAKNRRKTEENGEERENAKNWEDLRVTLSVEGEKKKKK